MNGKVLLWRINQQKQRIERSAIQTFDDYNLIKLLDDISAYILSNQEKENHSVLPDNDET